MTLSLILLGLALGAVAHPVRSIWVATLVHAMNNLFATL
jgi:membrane protease YdiL (CAAX protease family)